MGLTSGAGSRSHGLIDRSIGDEVEGIRTTQAKEGMVSLSGVMGDMLPLQMNKLPSQIAKLCPYKV